MMSRMSESMITVEIHNRKTSEQVYEVHFGAFKHFLAFANSCKANNRPDEVLRVHIPGSFAITNEERDQLHSLGVERF